MLRPYTRRLLLLLPTTATRPARCGAPARRLGGALTGASGRPSTFEGGQPAALLTLDLAAPERAAEQAAAFARRHPVAGVVGVDDDTAVVAAAIAGRLELTGNPVAAALAARDKHMQRVELARHGAPVPRFELHGLGEDVTDFAARLRYPCVLKPLRLAASRGVIRADDPAGFAAAFQRVGRILAQPDVAGCGDWTSRVPVVDFIPGPAVALQGLAVAGRLPVLAPFASPVPTTGVLRELRGVAAARTVPLIEDVVITAHPGQMLLPWPEGWRYPGFIFARGETPEAVEAALRTAHRRLEFIIE